MEINENPLMIDSIFHLSTPCYK